MFEDDLRSAMKGLAPKLDDRGVWAEVERRARHGRGRRRGLLVAATALVIATMAFGGFGLYEAVRPHDVVVVISSKQIPGTAGTADGPPSAEPGRPVELFQTPRVWDIVEMDLRGNLLAWTEKLNATQDQIDGKGQGGAAVIKAMDLTTGQVVEVPGSRSSAPGNMAVPTWFAVLPGDGGKPAVVFSVTSQNPRGKYFWSGVWTWQLGQKASHPLLPADQLVLQPVLSSDTALLPVVNVEGQPPAEGSGNHVMLLTGRTVSPASLPSDKLQAPSALLQGLDPYWTGWFLPEVGVGQDIYDLRTGQPVHLDTDVAALPRGTVVVAGGRAAWTLAIKGGRSGGSLQIHVADLASGKSQVVASVPGDDNGGVISTDLALNKDWLVWLEARNTPGTPMAPATWSGFDLVGVHLPDLTPFRIPEVVGVGETVQLVLNNHLRGQHNFLWLGGDTAVFATSTKPFLNPYDWANPMSVRMVKLAVGMVPPVPTPRTTMYPPDTTVTPAPTAPPTTTTTATAAQNDARTQRIVAALKRQGFEVVSASVKDDRLTAQLRSKAVDPQDRLGSAVYSEYPYKDAAAESLRFVDLTITLPDGRIAKSERVTGIVDPVARSDPAQAERGVTSWIATEAKKKGFQASVAFRPEEFQADLRISGTTAQVKAAVEAYFAGGKRLHDAGQLELLAITGMVDGKAIFLGWHDYVTGQELRLYQGPGIMVP
jgi:hypothetical protein